MTPADRLNELKKRVDAALQDWTVSTDKFGVKSMTSVGVTTNAFIFHDAARILSRLIEKMPPKHRSRPGGACCNTEYANKKAMDAHNSLRTEIINLLTEDLT